MKIETPQILWNAEDDKGLNAALYSIAMVSSGIEPHQHILATAGTTSSVNLWSLCLPPDHGRTEASTESTFETQRAQHHQSSQQQSVPLEFRCSLSRTESAVNAVSFSPDGVTLAAAGEGAVVLYSVPWSMCGNDNGRHFWSTVRRQADLAIRILPCGHGSVMDLSWSSDGQRLLLGTIDHAVWMFQKRNQEEWELVYQHHEHLHYVQGVAYDPLGVYLASMSNDRSVRVVPRKKATTKALKKILQPAQTDDSQNQPSSQSSQVQQQAPLHTEALLQEWLATTQFQPSKTRVLKHGLGRNFAFADESTLESFFRRLAWTTDGAYLVCPAGLWKQPQAGSTGAPPQNQAQHAVFLFARHRFDEPQKVLLGLDKPALVVCPNPKLWQLPQDDGISKENRGSRSIFAVLTWDTVLIYDTYHSNPLALVQGLHFSNFSDAAWSADGHSLVVSSTDGYVSWLRFAPGELGQVLPGDAADEEAMALQRRRSAPARLPRPNPSTVVFPPCEPGSEALMGRPHKRTKTTTDQDPVRRDVPGTSVTNPLKRNQIQDATMLVKKKKRIQPVLLVTEP